MTTTQHKIPVPGLDFGVPEQTDIAIGSREPGVAAARTQYGVFLDGVRIGFVASTTDLIDGKWVPIWLGSDGHTKKGLKRRNEAVYRLVASHLGLEAHRGTWGAPW